MRRWPDILLLLLCLAGWSRADTDTGKSDAPRFDPVVPINQKVKGMHLPYYAPNGVLRMQFDAEGAMRTDETNIQLEKLRIESFDEKGKSEMTVIFPSAIFNLATNLITSEDRVIVKRADFQITGKGMEFDTKKKSGRLFSEIRMEIFSKESTTPKPASTMPANGK